MGGTNGVKETTRVTAPVVSNTLRRRSTINAPLFPTDEMEIASMMKQLFLRVDLV